MTKVVVIGSVMLGILLAGAQPAGASPPANGAAPTISGMETNGDVYVGSTLHAMAGRWSGVPAPTYSYRWQYQAANGAWPDIAAATGPTYTVQPSDLGSPIRVNVTAANSDGSAEQVSAQTTPVKNGPVNPPAPPDPPADALGSPLNSRVVSADNLLITRHVNDESGSYRAGVVARTTSAGTASVSNFGGGLGYSEGNWDVYDHNLPQVTAPGRFNDQDFDSVLQLEARPENSPFDAGPLQMVLRSASSDVLAKAPGDPSTTLNGGDVYTLQNGNCDGDPCSLHEAPTADGNNVQAVAQSLNDERAGLPGGRASWTAVALPGAGVVALVNRFSGRCLGTAPGSDTAPIVSQCGWGDVPARQAWTAKAVLPDNPASPITLVNQASGLVLTHTAGEPTLAAAGSAPDVNQQWNLDAYKVKFQAGNVNQVGDDVPSYSFSANPVTYTMAAGDLDRVSEYGDTYTYHDEAAIAWVPAGDTPAPPTVRVVDYVAGGVVRPVPIDLAAPLPAPGAVRNGRYFPGSLGLAPGDFDGDSFNELAYTWQDSAGTFRVTLLEYRAGADKTRSLQVVGPAAGIPLFNGGGAPTPRLETGLAETKTGDFDGDGRDDLAIAFAATGASALQPSAYVGVVSFTHDLGVRGQQFSSISSSPLYFEGDTPERATRGLRLAPGLLRIDPEVGYTMERRQLAVAWTDTNGVVVDTKVAVLSVDPDANCSQATCNLAVNQLAAPRLVRSAPPPSANGYPLPLSLAAGGLRGRGAGAAPPLWGIAVTVDSVGENFSTEPDTHLYTLAVNPDSSASSGFGLSVLQNINLDAVTLRGRTQVYTVTAFDPAGASLVLGAPAVLRVQKLKRTTLAAAQPPVHADWDWDLNDPATHKPGAFLNVSRFSNFTVTLGSTQTKTYQHTHTHDTTADAGVKESVDVKGSFSNDLEVESSSASVEAKQKFQYKWTTTSGDFSNSQSQMSTSLTQTSNDDDLFQGSIEDSTLYRYPIVGGQLRDADGNPVSSPNCGQECYGVYEILIPGKVTPIATSGRLVDFFQPSWENGNALSYPAIDNGTIPTPDLGPYTYVDQNGNTQSVNGPLLAQEFGVGGASTKATVNITGTTGSGNSSGGGQSWKASGDVTATGSYRLGTEAVNYAGSVSVSIGGFGNSNTTTDDTGQTINTSGSAFELDVPEITSSYGYNIGTTYYYDSGGAARVNHAVDLTSNNQSEWWADNYGGQPDPALNMPNRVSLTTNQFNQQIVPFFATDARHQLIRGFRAFHTDKPDAPTFSNEEYTTNPTVGDQVRFQVPVRNYSLIPVANVPVSFYAVPMRYNGLVPVVAGAPVRIGGPQIVDQIPAQGTANVSSPVWTASVQQGVAGIQPWRIFVVLDENATIDETHEWKDSNGPCPVGALDPQPARGTVIGGVMADPMTGQASALACGQNNQGFGEISVAASAPAAAAAGARTTTVLDAANDVEQDAPGVELAAGGVLTEDRGTEVMEPGEIAHVRRGELVHAAAYVGAEDESPHHQTVLVYDGPPESGKLIAVTTLRGATAADDHRVPFTWRAERLGRHTLHVRLLGHAAAGEDDLLTIPVVVEEPEVNTAPVARGDAYRTREGRTLRVRAPGVLRNDRDAEGGALSARRVSGPAHGSLALSGDGSFRYRPDRRFVGSDGFTYRAGDGRLASDPVRVTVTVKRLPRCLGRRATIVGTRRSEAIRGTARADVIVAFAGKDRIRAGRGDDRVCAGSGRDRVDGGAGRDRILGGVDGDRLLGGSSADLIDAGRGHDTLVGGRGKDLLRGRAGRDRLLGGPDTDILVGGPDRDMLLVRPGRDLVRGDRGRDLIRGRPGPAADPRARGRRL